MLSHDSGLRVLLAPDQLERAEAVTGEELQRVLSVMRTMFDYIFVDTSPFLDQTTLVLPVRVHGDLPSLFGWVSR